jgi:hypothetical protein
VIGVDSFFVCGDFKRFVPKPDKPDHICCASCLWPSYGGNETDVVLEWALDGESDADGDTDSDTDSDSDSNEEGLGGE